MHIGFFCYDNAGGNAMKLLADTAAAMGHTVKLFPKQVRDQAVTAWLALKSMDMMVTGLSSFLTEEELAFADQCRKNGVPWVVFEDVPGACRRPKVKEYAPHAAAVIVAHPMMVAAAKVFGYTGELAYLGPPPQWRTDYRTLIEARKVNLMGRMTKVDGNTGVAMSVPVGDDDMVIGLVGGKDPVENNRVLRIVVEAAKQAPRVVIAFAKHPGEKPERKSSMTNAEYEELERVFDRLFAERHEILAEVQAADVDGWNGMQVAATVNVMVYASGTNISIAGAYAGVPGIYLDDDGVRERMREQTGQDNWFVADLGGAIKVKNAGSLVVHLGSLSTESGLRQLRRAQEAAFPMPNDWFTEPKIIRFIEKVVNRAAASAKKK